MEQFKLTVLGWATFDDVSEVMVLQFQADTPEGNEQLKYFYKELGYKWGDFIDESNPLTPDEGGLHLWEGSAVWDATDEYWCFTGEWRHLSVVEWEDLQEFLLPISLRNG